jgi:hypothetical protein
MKILPALVLLTALPCAAAPPVISEFMAINHGPSIDDTGANSDWIEIRNPGPGSVDLAGWTLTDEPDIPAKWTFPAVSLGAGELLLVRASGLDRRVTGQELHTNFALSGDGEFLALYSPESVVSSVWQPYPKQFGGVSYGLAEPGGGQGYFAQPTPGESNGDTVLADYVRDTHFSVSRGFFTGPFMVTLTCDTPGAAIRYTTDGSVPGEFSPLYSTPLTITTTTTLRIRGFRDGLVPSNADTQTYIFPAVWKSQPDFPAGFSQSWGTFSGSFKVLADYGMNSPVTNDAVYGPLVIPAMTQTFPVVCITGGAEEIFGDNSIHGDLRNTDAEVPVAVEFFNPLAPAETFTTRAGFQAHGGAVRNYAKKGFRIDFTGVHGDGTLQFPLFPGSPVETFDQLVLRTGGHDSWTVQTRGGNPDNNDLAYHAGYLRDQFLRRTEVAAGVLSPRGRWVHLCINGLYWGLYDLHERPNAEWTAAHAGGAETAWDVLHHNAVSASFGPESVDGDLTEWNNLQNLCTSPVGTDAAYLQLAALLGPERYIDHLLIRMWAGDHDWLGPAYMPSSTLGTTGDVAVYSGKNWYAVRDSRNTPAGPWRFFTWDGEISMGNHLLYRFFDGLPTPPGLEFPHLRELHLDVTGIARADTPAAMWNALRGHPEFRSKVADRAHRLLHNGGLLSPASAAARLDAMITELDPAMVAESARWGGVSGIGFRNIGGVQHRTWDNGLLTRDTHWRPEVTWLRDTFAEERGQILQDQLAARGLYPLTEPVTITPFGGSVGAADPIELSAAAGVIYYTTNGTDPRVPLSGSISGSALIYTAPLTTGGVTPLTIKTRAYAAGWSPLTEVTFISGVPPAPASLVLTQLHYHPAPPTPAEEAALGFSDADAFEYLRLTNVSGDSLDLSGLRFAAGVDFDFAVHSSLRELPAGGSVVLGSHAAAFQLRYSAAAHGIFANGTHLSNSGEQLKLVRSDGTVIFDIEYNDRGDWPAAADGDGPALHLLGPGSGTDPGESGNWRAAAAGPFDPVAYSLSFENWRGDFFTAEEITAGLADPLADPDGDRLENVFEYLTKSNPRRATQSPVRVSFPQAGKVRFSYELRAGETAPWSLALQTSAGLGAWAAAAPTGTPSTDNATVEQVHDFDLPPDGRLFGRLRAVSGP